MDETRRTIENDLFGTKPRKKNINSREKGANNERECAKVLEIWTGEKFARVPSSGGLRWTNTVNACGDLICQNQDFAFPFSVETKHLKQVMITSTELRANSKIFTIFLQAIKDARRAGQCPFLLIRVNGMRSRTYMAYLPFMVEGCTVLQRGMHKDTGIMIYGYGSTQLLSRPYADLKALADKWKADYYS